MRVALVLPHATTLRKRRLVSAILFDEFEVREIAYMPAAQCSLAALGLCTAMLIKIGHSSCSVNPVRTISSTIDASRADHWQIYDGRMLFYQGKDSQIGLDAMHRRARLLLSRHTSGLTDGDVRNFVYRHASVSSMRMATSEKHSIDDEAAVPASGEHEVSDEVQWRQPSTGTSISLPAWYGKATAEVLFEADGAYADTDEVGLGRMLRDVLAACPLDTRTELRRIVVTGVGHRLPGLQARLSAELPGSKIVVHGMADDLTWTGASLAAHLRWRVPTLTATAWEEAQGNLAS